METKSESVKASLEPLSSFISALSSSGNVTFSSDVPAGCVVSVVNDDVNVHIMLKVNFSHETQFLDFFGTKISEKRFSTVFYRSSCVRP